MTDPASTAPFAWPVRVYWEDTDAGGVVYHGSFVRFFERARSEWLRALGIDQLAFKRDTGLVFMVREMQIDFFRPALLDDELLVSVELKQRRAASILCSQSIRRSDGIELVGAQVKIACVDIQQMRPVPIPDQFVARLAGG